jgi:hypothetical protein
MNAKELFVTWLFVVGMTAVAYAVADKAGVRGAKKILRPGG